MDLACPACGTAIAAGAEGFATVVVCAACSRRVEVNAAGETVTLAVEDPARAATIDDHHRAATDEPTRDHLPETVSRATRPSGNAMAGNFSAGQRFGDYEILAEIARGGMGVVFKARQIKLHRVVALKMILSGQLAREDQVARFYAEAQAAAHLDHPGIVPVYEVGEVDGQHFFSMGFVEGKSLAGRLADGPLPPREASELIHATSRAVAYAHAQGVIHRDLKPSNILLDAAGQPRVTDFGLAKSVADGGERGRELTLAGAIIGTPSYMPPEQAAGRVGDVGAAADVYSLGATLYCLLVGRPPFQAASVAETLRQVIEREPVSPRRINPAIDLDLETICLKCLEKEPARRYKTTTDLAEDLHRYLEHRPIVARPISAPARLIRWGRRNPRIAALAAALVFVLVGGTVVSTYFAVKATNNANYYRLEKERADGETQKAKDNAEFFRLEKVRADDETQKAVVALRRESAALQKQAAALEETESSIYKYVQTIQNAELLRDARFQPLLKELLAESAAHYERYIERHKNDRDAAARSKLAAAIFEVAAINTFRGTTDAAAVAYDQALVIQDELMREHPGDIQYEAALARTHHNRGNLLQKIGQPVDALAVYELARGLRERLAAGNPSVDEYQYDLFSTLNNIGNLHYQSSRPREALAAFDQALQVQQRLAAAHPANVKYQIQLSALHMNRGNLLFSTRQHVEALDALQKAKAIQEDLVKNNPKNTEAHVRLAGSMQNLGNLHSELEQRAEAVASYERAVQIFEQVALSNPTIDEYQSEWASNLSNLGLEYGSAGRTAEAQVCYEKAIAIHERLVRLNPSVLAYQVSLAGTCVNLSMLKATAKPAAAAAELERAIGLLQPVLQKDSSSYVARTYLRNAFMGRADLHSAAGRFAQAADDWQRALDIDKNGDRVMHYSNLRELAMSLARAGKHQQAAAAVGQLDRLAKVGDQWRNLAKVLSLCCAAAAKDQALAPDERAKLAEIYAVQAVGFLTRAAEFGIYRNPDRVQELHTSPDYDALRARDDFRKLLESWKTR